MISGSWRGHRPPAAAEPPPPVPFPRQEIEAALDEALELINKVWPGIDTIPWAKQAYPLLYRQATESGDKIDAAWTARQAARFREALNHYRDTWLEIVKKYQEQAHGQ